MYYILSLYPSAKYIRNGMHFISYFKPTILVVDDEPSVRKSLTILLKQVGDIITASGGEEALKQLKHSHIDLMLLDIRLPKMDGMEVLKKAIKSDENIMVIMITAVRDMQTAVEAMKLGAMEQGQGVEADIFR